MERKRVIRILQVGVSPCYGGTEAFLMSQYRAIDHSKVQFDFLNVYSEKIACQGEIEALGGHIYYLDMARHHGITQYYRNLDAFFKKYARRFDGVHCNFQSLINIDILKYAKKYGVTVRIAHAHNSGYGTEPSGLQKALIYWNRITLGRYATHYFACSSLAAKWMFGRETTIIKNAIDTDRFVYSKRKRPEVRCKLGLKDEYVVIFVGRLDPQKNPIFMLDIFSEVHKACANSVLFVVGDGVMREEMESRISHHCIQDSVVMFGSRNDVHELMQAADVFLLPSKFEGLGIVLVEAQAAGLPTITSAEVVPNDVAVTNLLHFCSLDAPAKEWADTVLSARSTVRMDRKQEIVDSGFDCVRNAVIMEKLYTDLLRGNI